MLRVEPQWWDADDLRHDKRFKYEPEMQGYDDYVATLTPDEFRELHERYRPRAFWPKGTEENCYDQLPLLDAIAGYLTEDRHHFTVTVFEWESGF
jgi:hypothetical protein